VSACGFVLLGASIVYPESTDAHNPRLEQTVLTGHSRRPILQSRWDRFETDFGWPRDMSRRTASILPALYGANLAASGVKVLSNVLEDSTEIRLTRGRWCRASASDIDLSARNAHLLGPFSVEDVRLKFDFEMENGKPYVGARLVFPFGN
jgi:hypothetical protein